MAVLTGSERSRVDAEAKGLKIGTRVRWNVLGRQSFKLPQPSIRGVFKGTSNVGGFGTVLWDGRASVDTIDLQFIERVA